jgi:hypothetical protein
VRVTIQIDETSSLEFTDSASVRAMHETANVLPLIQRQQVAVMLQVLARAFGAEPPAILKVGNQSNTPTEMTLDSMPLIDPRLT